VRSRIDESGYDIRLEVDGGINVDNIRLIKESGADTFVSGSTIFGAIGELDPNKYDSVIQSLRSKLAEVKL
jgi:ribulose-phosphate 3-epimerase